MASYTLSNKAVLDLSAIWQYTADSWSVRQADKYYFMLLESCQDLAEGMVSGKKYPEINTGVLGFKAGQHILFYRIPGVGKIEIIRILHAQMDLKNRVQE